MICCDFGVSTNINIYIYIYIYIYITVLALPLDVCWTKKAAQRDALEPTCFLCKGIVGDARGVVSSRRGPRGSEQGAAEASSHGGVGSSLPNKAQIGPFGQFE